MQYTVSRAGYNSTSEPPCNGAVRKMLPYYHERSCKSFEEFDKRFADREGTWLSKGTEHKLTSTGISRREGSQEEWVVNIRSLKQLQDFIVENGQIVMDRDSILIYDDYIE